MAIAFPMPLADFFGALKITSMTFELGSNLEHSETGDGQILATQRGQRLWSGTIELAPGAFLTQEAMQARLDVLSRPGASLLIGHPFATYPQVDETGALFRDQALQVATRISGRELTIKGGHPHAALLAGDHMSISFGSGRLSYHRLVGDAVFDGAGLTEAVEVVPDLPLGVVEDDAVTVINPVLKAIIRPDSSRPGSLRPAQIVRGAQFAWIQSLR